MSRTSAVLICMLSALASAGSSGVAAPPSTAPADLRLTQLAADRAAIRQQLGHLEGLPGLAAELAPFRKAVEERIRNKPAPAKGRQFIANDVPLAGADGFLFSARRAAQLLHETTAGGDKVGNERYDQAARAIIDTARQLAAQDITLIVVPAPNKSNTYADLLAPLPKDAPIHQLQSKRLYARLLDAGVEVVDLEPLFAQARKDAPVPLYMRRDTHWSPAGSRLAAGEVARRLLRLPTLATARKQPARSKLAEADFTNSGDLAANWIATGQKGFPNEKHRVPAVAPLQGGIHDDKSAPVIVMGDSYANFPYQRGQMFWEYLGHDLNTNVQIHTRAGGGCEVPRDLARILKQRKSPPVAVVWLFTSCSLYETDFATAPLPTQAEGARQPAAITAELLEDLPRLDPATTPYPNALAAMKVKVHTVHEGRLDAPTITVALPILMNRQPTSTAKLAKGAKIKLRLTPDIPTAQRAWTILEENPDITTLPWYAVPLTPDP